VDEAKITDEERRILEKQKAQERRERDDIERELKVKARTRATVMECLETLGPHPSPSWNCALRRPRSTSLSAGQGVATYRLSPDTKISMNKHFQTVRSSA
jgi:hypothetical protein